MRRVSDERGATAIMVALLMIPVFGFGALVIDVGALYQERRELQNGADAAALAVAKDCSPPPSGVGNCNASSPGSALGYANVNADLNADDGDSNIDKVCGVGPGLSPPCTDPPPFPNYVRVTTSTREVASGTNKITYQLARVLVNDAGGTVYAKTTAAWGAVGAATAKLPLTISMNEFNCLLPGGIAGLPSAEKTIVFHTSNQATRADCTIGTVSGLDNPGGFGWLTTDGKGQCSAEVNSDQQVAGSNGASPPRPANKTGCDSAFFASLIGKEVLMPIFSSVTKTTDPDPENKPSGKVNLYFIQGFAGFRVSGYDFQGSLKSSPPPPSCPASNSCISGRFVAYYAAGAQPEPGGTGTVNFGATAVAVVG